LSPRPTLVAAVLALIACHDGGAEDPPDPPAPETSVVVTPVGFELDDATITTAGGEEVAVELWIADSADERGRGLMEVTDLGGADGMLFVFESEALYRFYMWRTPMPLDIAFFAADGSFVGEAAMEPCLDGPADRCARYAPDAPFLLALEVPAGELDTLGIGPGSRLDGV
jgi:uncharacterized protein